MANGTNGTSDLGDGSRGGLILIQGGNSEVYSDDWIWNSEEAMKGGVGAFRNKAGDLIATSGVRKLQRAILLSISGDHFYVERRTLRTCDAAWFAELLERFVGQDRTTRSGLGARGEWAALIVVILGLVANDDKHRFGEPKLSASLNIILASGDTGRLSDWAEKLDEDQLALVSYSTYLWLPSLLVSMASQACVYGAQAGDKVAGFSTWMHGSIVVPQVITLGMRWEQPGFEFQFDYDVETDLEDEEKERIGSVMLVRADLSDPEIRSLALGNKRAWKNVRITETSAHVAEVVKVVSAEVGTLAVAAVEITWETAIDPNVLPSVDARSLFPRRVGVDLVNAEQRLQVHVRDVWSRFGTHGLEQGVGHQLLGIGLGKQLRYWIEESLKLRVKPSLPLSVHVTPAPGRSHWEAVLMAMKDEISCACEMDDSPDSACIEVEVHRVGPHAAEPGYPMLATVNLEQAEDEDWEKLREAASLLGGFGATGKPLLLMVDRGRMELCAGWPGDAEEVAINPDIEDEQVHSRFNAAVKLMRSKKTLRTVSKVAARSVESVEDEESFVVVFLWGWFQLECVFDRYIWEDVASWPEEYSSLEEPGVCSVVVMDRERERLLDEAGALTESARERFWGRAFPETLRAVVRYAEE